MTAMIKDIVIVGGGSAGWLTAGLLAAKKHSVTLIESPNIPILGVGEGTWPSMRCTLQKLGIKESDFIRACDVSFKQGSKFVGWHNGQADDEYLHPFELPNGYFDFDIAMHWYNSSAQQPFAQTVNSQYLVCKNQLAPKQISTPEYAGVTNYGYHLDATKFALFLQQHCCQKLGVNHVVAHVDQVNTGQQGDIDSLSLTSNPLSEIKGDLFIDCTGQQALLIGQHYQVPLKSVQDTLFVDSAIAVQVPYPTHQQAIASTTIASAQSAGWIWDIGLPTRRGVGYVFSSRHCSQYQAEQTLKQYLIDSDAGDIGKLTPKLLSLNPGIREQFWVNNCLAIGMSAGFIEPLEASALAMVELAAQTLTEQLPLAKAAMPIVAKQFNEKFHYNWQRVIDFLKLHYCLSERQDSQFWRDNRALSSIPEHLQALLTLWRHRSPSDFDFAQKREVFSAASYQYVLYGMKKLPREFTLTLSKKQQQLAQHLLVQTQKQSEQLIKALPSNRELLDKISQFGLQTI